MITLGIETSAGLCSCSLLEDENLIKEVHFKTKNQQQNLMPSVEKLYKDSQIDKWQTKLIGVNIGPGAFTSLRIGVATAKSLAHALKIPIVGISSLNALYEMSLEVDSQECDRVIIIDARRNKLFTSIYYNNELKYDNLDLHLNDVLYYIKDSKKVIFIGSGINRYEEAIKEQTVNKDVIFIKEDQKELNASLIAKLAYKKYKTSGADDMHSLIPLYVRNTDAVTKGK